MLHGKLHCILTFLLTALTRILAGRHLYRSPYCRVGSARRAPLVAVLPDNCHPSSYLFIAWFYLGLNIITVLSSDRLLHFIFVTMYFYIKWYRWISTFDSCFKPDRSKLLIARFRLQFSQNVSARGNGTELLG